MTCRDFWGETTMVIVSAPVVAVAVFNAEAYAASSFPDILSVLVGSLFDHTPKRGTSIYGTRGS